MELNLESTYALPATVRGFAGRADQGSEDVPSLRWSLGLDGPAPESCARFSVGMRILTRGRVTTASPLLEEAMGLMFGRKTGLALKYCHRVQAALWAACGGLLPEAVESDLGRVGVFSEDEARGLLDRSLLDLEPMSCALSRLYPQASPARPPTVFLSFRGESRPGRVNVAVRDGWLAGARPGAAAPGAERPGRLSGSALPAGGAAGWPAVRPEKAWTVLESDLRGLLERIFRHKAFRPGQAEALGELLAGRDVGILLPTGAGKSLVFQLAALLRPGTALVVEPLLALMRDQLRWLSRCGITRAAALGSDDPQAGQEALAALERGDLALCYVSPERLETRSFQEACRRVARGPGFSFAAIDEAHCVTQWGHDFRPAYLGAGRKARLLCSGQDSVVPLAALTGTATPSAMAGMRRELGLAGAAVVAAPSLARPELEYRVLRCGRSGHVESLERLLAAGPEAGLAGPGVVFCPHVDGALGAAEVARNLSRRGGVVACFTGRTPDGWQRSAWERERACHERRFLESGSGLMAATSAFGMGVHKPDIRFTVHLGLPLSWESLYQESGRAGRDGRKAACWVITHVRSASRARRWLCSGSVEELSAELAALPRGEADDVSLALGLHLASFPGAEVERADCETILRALGDLSRPRVARLGMAGQARLPLERAAHRLCRTGVLEAAVSRSTQGPVLEVRLDGGAGLREVMARVEAELETVYGEIEPGRRASLWSLAELCLKGDGQALSRRLSL
ncbi:MAG: ATP-dependent DNA helicase RecQ [Elusimicrobia bacterium]|nr:ATP-dependent DNA helicase RecQ [Elusimicrobiota bacterium]